ncbi:hypothetical protein PSD17_06250 [Pseudonocardia sp. D17]|nr:hypothetical protein PSD17_06250 [Pseudonocardia sp. D17]
MSRCYFATAEDYMTPERPQCALPGCTERVPEVEVGRPPRRYCSSAHHADDRRRRSEDVVELRHPGSEPLVGVGAATERSRDTRKTRRPPLGSRAWQLVGAIGVVGLVIAGDTFVQGTTSWPDSDPGPRTVAPASWESQARRALASIDRQLASIATTEAIWNTQIASHYLGTPEQVQVLLARKTLLEQQRAALQSQLATLDQLAEARAAVAALDQQIAHVTATLDDLPPIGRLSPDQLYVRDALTARRALLLQERVARQADVDRLQLGVIAAQRSPVLDPADQTTPLVQRVLDLRDRRPSAPPEQPAPPVTNSEGRPEPTILAASDPAPASHKAAASARSGLGPTGAVSDAVARPVREVDRQNVPSSSGGSSPSKSGAGSASSRKASPPPPERDSSDASRSDSDSDAPAPRSASASRRSSGASSGGTSSGSSAQEAYDYAMNTPQGRMAGFIAGASGAPVG